SNFLHGAERLLGVLSLISPRPVLSRTPFFLFPFSPQHPAEQERFYNWTWDTHYHCTAIERPIKHNTMTARTLGLAVAALALGGAQAALDLTSGNRRGPIDG